MERRRSERKNVQIDARILTEKDSCDGVIENIAEDGICLETESKNLLSTTTRFHPGSEYKIAFQTPGGDDIKLHCKVAWSYKIAPHGLKRKIGMEIIFPPPVYVVFYRNLAN